jgi:pyruvate/2-oxoglutarate dehydrogenase complex dihydrolipoamide dehydrogenase (E3) component
VIDAVEVLDGKQAVSGAVLVVGGGMVGAETADFLGEQGCRVTIVEMDDAIAKAVQPGPRLYLLKRLTEYDTTVIVGATVTAFHPDGVTYRADGTAHRLDGFDAVVLALGATAHNPLEAALRGHVREIHVLGDAVKARPPSTQPRRRRASRGPVDARALAANGVSPRLGGTKPTY